MDEENLTQAMIEQLLRYMPTQDMLNQFASMTDEYSSLAEPEQFCVIVCIIGCYWSLVIVVYKLWNLYICGQFDQYSYVYLFFLSVVYCSTIDQVSYLGERSVLGLLMKQPPDLYCYFIAKHKSCANFHWHVAHWEV